MAACQRVYANHSRSLSKSPSERRTRGRPSSRFSPEKKAQCTAWARERLPVVLFRMRAWTDAELRVLDVILNRLNHKGVAKIAGHQGAAIALLSENGWFKIVQRLERDGILTVHNEKICENRRTINEYRPAAWLVKEVSPNNRGEDFPPKSPSELKRKLPTAGSRLRGTRKGVPASRPGQARSAGTYATSADHGPRRSESVPSIACAQVKRAHQGRAAVSSETTAKAVQNGTKEERRYLTSALAAIDPHGALAWIEGRMPIEAIIDRHRAEIGYDPLAFARAVEKIGIAAILMLLCVRIEVAWDVNAIRHPARYLRGALSNPAGCHPLSSLSRLFHEDTYGSKETRNAVRPRRRALAGIATLWIASQPEAEQRKLYDRYRTRGHRVSTRRTDTEWKIEAWIENGHLEAFCNTHRQIAS